MNKGFGLLGILILIVGIAILVVYSFYYLNSDTKIIRDSVEIEDAIITLERTSCYDNCPIYKLTISGDGHVVYEGEQFVNVIGRKTTQISQDKIIELVDEFYKADFFSLKDSYERYEITDNPSTITSITLNGVVKTVRHYHGDTNAPKKLIKLEDRIDEIVNSDVWVEDNSEMGNVARMTLSQVIDIANKLIQKKGANLDEFKSEVVYADQTWAVYYYIETKDSLSLHTVRGGFLTVYINDITGEAELEFGE